MKNFNLKHSIWSLIISFLFLIIITYILVSFVYMKDVNMIILFVTFEVVDILVILYKLKNVQTVYIYDNKITVRNIYGTIKTIEINEIKKVYIDNLIVFSLKNSYIRRKYIVVSQNESLIKANVYDAYNRKKNKYITICYNEKAYAYINNLFNKVEE